ncbi:MAG: VTT domain-containing protein [Sandaracinaceae bacterium]
MARRVGGVSEPEHETVVDETSRPRSQRWRTWLLVAFFVGTLVAAKATGLTDWLDVETVRTWMQSWGVWGFLGFLGIFAAGELMHVPGMVFVGAASIAYGQAWGIPAAYLGSLVSVAASFIVVRAIGGQPLGDVRKPWMRKVLGRLSDRPVRTVALLRLVLFLAPALNYGLAMSSVRFRDYMLGSALGLLLPIPAMVLLFDWLAAIFL